LKDDLAADLNQTIALLAGTGEPGPLRMADALSLWRASTDSVRLEDALGVAPTWRSAERRRKRDRLYVQIGQTHFPHLKGLPLARAIIAEIDRYQTSSWPRDRDNGRRPAGANGLIFDLLSLGEHLLDAAMADDRSTATKIREIEHKIEILRPAIGKQQEVVDRIRGELRGAPSAADRPRRSSRGIGAA
jgi:hypothetical protein